MRLERTIALIPRAAWRSAIAAGALAAALALPAAAPAQTPKAGGVLNVMQREELPQGLSIHETSTIATVWPASPCFNNLVYFDPMKPAETAESIVGELAEKWSWQDGYRARPTVSWGVDHFAHWPHVKNLVPHHSLYSFGRMQEVWLDR